MWVREWTGCRRGILGGRAWGLRGVSGGWVARWGGAAGGGGGSRGWRYKFHPSDIVFTEALVSLAMGETRGLDGFFGGVDKGMVV